MKVIAIAIAFVASAAIANPTATGTTTTTTETTHAAPHGKAHGKTMKMDKKMDAAHTMTAPTACTKEDEKAGKCKPEMTK